MPNTPQENKSSTPKRVTGLGGIFFKCNDPEKTKQWYQTHLGMAMESWGTNFEWRQADDPDRKGFSAWAAFPETSTFFDKSTRKFMINYRVENLERLVEQLKAEGVTIADAIKQETYGKFVHIVDPEGMWIELWEPNDDEYDKIVERRTK